MFPAYAVVTALLLVACLRVPRLPVRLGERPAGQITQMIFRPAWLIFALCSFLIWTAASGSIAFLGVTINSMGGSDSLIGLAATTAAIAEIPFMFFSGMMMRRMGMQRMLWASMFFFTLRIGLYGFMPAPVWAVGINLINGPSYRLFLEQRGQLRQPAGARFAQSHRARAVSIHHQPGQCGQRADLRLDVR